MRLSKYSLTIFNVNIIFSCLYCAGQHNNTNIYYDLLKL